MNRLSQIVMSLITVLVMLLTACSKRDKVIGVAGDDPEIMAAISKARETLPHFWQVFDKPERGESGFSLKVRITDKKGIEHFWATDVERRDGKMVGNRTLKPLFKKMPAAEVERLKRMMADP